LIVTKISFSQKESKNSLKRRDTVNQLGARTVGTKERLTKEPVPLDDKNYVMPTFDITEKRHRINIFKLGDGYYFKHFFDNPDLFRELEQYYEKQTIQVQNGNGGRTQ
jgi:hypothetical protein